MKECSNCGFKYPGSMKTCPSCGHKEEEVIPIEELDPIEQIPDKEFRKLNVVTVEEWINYHLLMVIPGINIIYFLCVLFNPRINKSKRNYLISKLLIWLFIIGLLVGGFYFMTKVLDINPIPIIKEFIEKKIKK